MRGYRAKPVGHSGKVVDAPCTPSLPFGEVVPGSLVVGRQLRRRDLGFPGIRVEWVVQIDVPKQHSLRMVHAANEILRHRRTAGFFEAVSMTSPSCSINSVR